MDTSMLTRVLGDFYAATMLVSSIVGFIFLAQHHRLRYVAPLLILAGVAFCSLVLDVSSRPPVLVKIGAAVAVAAVIAGFLVIVLGDIALWRMLTAPLPLRHYPLVLVSVILPAMVFLPINEGYNATGFALLANLALVVAGGLIPVCMTFFREMRAIRAARRAKRARVAP